MSTRSLDSAVEELCGDLRSIRAPRGQPLNARSWQTEAPLRMLLNNLDREVAERPEDLVVYGGSGRAARAHRERADRAALGDVGRVPPARGPRPDDVRADDRRKLDLHRHAGDPP